LPQKPKKRRLGQNKGERDQIHRKPLQKARELRSASQYVQSSFLLQNRQLPNGGGVKLLPLHTRIKAHAEERRLLTPNETDAAAETALTAHEKQGKVVRRSRTGQELRQVFRK
jgi:hypothetical protein